MNNFSIQLDYFKMSKIINKKNPRLQKMKINFTSFYELSRYKVTLTYY